MTDEHFAFGGRATHGPDGTWTIAVPASAVGLDALTDEAVANNVGRTMPDGSVIIAAQVSPDGSSMLLTVKEAEVDPEQSVVQEPPDDPRGYTKEQFARFMGDWFTSVVGQGFTEEEALAAMNHRLSIYAPQFRVSLKGRTVFIEDA